MSFDVQIARLTGSTAQSLHGRSAGIPSVLHALGLVGFVWSTNCGIGFPQVSAQVLPVGWSAGGEFRVHTHVPGDQYAPDVATIASEFIVVWHSEGQDPDNSTGVFGQRFDFEGNPIGEEFAATTNHTGLQRGARITGLGSGFIVSWHQGEVPEDLYGQLFDGNSSPIGGSFLLSNYTQDRQVSNDLASLPMGFIAVWSSAGQDPDGSTGVYGQLFGSDASKLGAEFRANSFTTGGQGAAHVIAPRDRFVVVWQDSAQFADSKPRIYGQVFANNGTRLGSEYLCSSRPASIYFGSASASLTAGYVTVWGTEFYGTDGGIGVYGQRFDDDANKVGPEFPADSPWGAQNSPSAAAVPGGFAVAWTGPGPSGSGHDVFALLLDGNAAPLGSVFQMNNFSNGQQRLVRLATLANGFVAVWYSEGQDPDGSVGIYGRVYTYRDPTATTLLSTNASTDVMSASIATLAPMLEPSSPLVGSTAQISSFSATLPETSRFLTRASEVPMDAPLSTSSSAGLIAGIVAALACFGITVAAGALCRRRRAVNFSSGSSSSSGSRPHTPRRRRRRRSPAATVGPLSNYDEIPVGADPPAAYDQVVWPARTTQDGYDVLGAVPGLGANQQEERA